MLNATCMDGADHVPCLHAQVLPAVGEVEGRCGDGVVGAGEARAMTATRSTRTPAPTECEARCRWRFVYGITDRAGEPGFEACDDGNINDRDACTNACVAATCGDGIWRRDLFLQTSRALNVATTATTTMTTPAPNMCSAGAAATACCARAKPATTETPSTPTGCLSTCVAARCAVMGFLRTDLNRMNLGYEACDGEEDCSEACRLMFCGNGVIEGTEACDDGNEVLTDACANCQEALRRRAGTG